MLLPPFTALLLLFASTALSQQSVAVGADGSVLPAAAGSGDSDTLPVAACTLTVRGGFEVRSAVFRCAIAPFGRQASTLGEAGDMRGALRASNHDWCSGGADDGSASGAVVLVARPGAWEGRR